MPIEQRVSAARVRGHVLIVDDEPMVSEVLRTIVANAGYRTSIASNGIDACKQIESSRFDAVICDIVMPEQDGIETIREIRKRSKDIWIVALSGADLALGFDVLTMCRRLGADETLSKPFEPQDVLRALSPLATSGPIGPATL